jgi:exodeoxyribonuclease V alpha subunit
MIPLSPDGTARQRIAPAASTWPAELRAALDAEDLPEPILVIAWELARHAGELSADERRAVERLVLATLLNARRGSTRLPVSGDEGLAHLTELFRALTPAGEDPAPAIATVRGLLAELRQSRLAGKAGRLGALVGLPGEPKPLVLDGYYLQPQRMLACEERLARALARRLAGDARPPDGLADALAGAEAASPVALSDEQRRAVAQALSRPLTIVSGGPGTGKTSVVATLVRVLRRLDPDGSIALAAPTGKAAQRLRAALDQHLAGLRAPGEPDLALRERLPEASTLHRLLGYSPADGRFRHHENNRLAERFVIVDEASMIDLALMDRLARAVRDDAHLVLLGDADQLPSVEAGAVFRDLVAAAETSAVRLTRNYRMAGGEADGRKVLAFAQRVQAGDADALEEATLRDAPAALGFAGVERLAPGSEEAFLERWLERVRAGAAGNQVWRRRPDGSFADDDARALAELFAHFERRRLLTATRAAAERANRLLHERVLAAERAPSTLAIHPGEPVVVGRNDYDRGLYNGDHGLVLRVADGGGAHHLAAVFSVGGQLAAFPLESIRNLLSLAYATTVHKSQGSEHDEVTVLLPARAEDDSPLLTRELIYTAVTRARRSVVLLGEPELFRRAIGRKIRRFSGVAAKLRAQS